jgi:hypothetical protein
LKLIALNLILYIGCRKEANEMRMTALRLLMGIALVGILAIPSTVFAEGHGFYRGGGRVVVVPRYSAYYPYWGNGWGWGPYWGGYGPYYVETTGKIKIKDSKKSDEVYINGSYAGTVDRMKNISLNPGSYTLMVRRQGKELFNQSVYVVVGKTVEITIEGG